MKKEVYIFGAGRNGRELLRHIGGAIAFIDNDPAKQSSVIDGLECISMETAVYRGAENGTILVSIRKDKKIEEQLEQYHFRKVCWCAEWLRKHRYYKPIVLEETDFRNAFPFNHYESPYPDIVEVHNKEKEIFDRNKKVLDIDFNVDRQLELIKEMENISLLEWSDGKTEGMQTRYSYRNGWFDKGSADALYYMMRIIKPRNIIEVGSGYSTAVMLDTNEFCFNNEIRIISIEPNADRLKSLLKSSDNLQIYEQKLQEIPYVLFDSLEENDILFIDSSHVSRIGSDVNYIFFEILPRLKKGVYIHFHDMFYPFIYPEEWVYSGRAYSEMYILRAFLMNNKEYSMQLFGDMLSRKYSEKIPEKLRGCGEASLWIRKEQM